MCRHGRRVEIALHPVTACLEGDLFLKSGLDAFGDNVHAKRMGETNRRANNCDAFIEFDVQGKSSIEL